MIPSIRHELVDYYKQAILERAKDSRSFWQNFSQKSSSLWHFIGHILVKRDLKAEIEATKKPQFIKINRIKTDK